jgi:hypothetical protein
MLKSDIREKLSYEKLMNLFGAAYLDLQNHYVSLSKDADIDAAQVLPQRYSAGRRHHSWHYP